MLKVGGSLNQNNEAGSMKDGQKIKEAMKLEDMFPAKCAICGVTNNK